MSSALKLIYTFFLGILVATFIGLGIAAFYPAPQSPKSPESPEVLKEVAPETNQQETPAVKLAREKYEKEWAEYQKTMNVYARNVFIIALICAVIILVISLTIARNIPVIADGLLLGGTFTLFYSIVEGFQTNDSKFRFLAVSLGLLITLIIGYFKFIKAEEKTKTAG